MLFMHFRVISEGLTDSFTQPVRFNSCICNGVLVPCIDYEDAADFFIFGDSYKDILLELKTQLSDGLLENLLVPSILYFGSSEDSYCSTFDIYNLYFKEENK